MLVLGERGEEEEGVGGEREKAVRLFKSGGSYPPLSSLLLARSTCLLGKLIYSCARSHVYSCSLSVVSFVSSAIDSSVLNESFKNYTRSLCGKCIDNDICEARLCIHICYSDPAYT